MKLLALLLVLLPTAARAADKALILNDQQQKELSQVLDAALKGYGVQIAVPAAHIIELLAMAPTVQAREQTKSPEESK